MLGSLLCLFLFVFLFFFLPSTGFIVFTLFFYFSFLFILEVTESFFSVFMVSDILNGLLLQYLSFHYIKVSRISSLGLL